MRNSPARGADDLYPADGLRIRILKLAFNSIGHLLLFLITTNDFPSSWKHSFVYPVHKAGDPANPSHFRPISILAVIAKIVKRAVQRRRQLHYPLSVI